MNARCVNLSLRGIAPSGVEGTNRGGAKRQSVLGSSATPPTLLEPEPRPKRSGRVFLGVSPAIDWAVEIDRATTPCCPTINSKGRAQRCPTEEKNQHTELLGILFDHIAGLPISREAKAMGAGRSRPFLNGWSLRRDGSCCRHYTFPMACASAGV